MAGKSRFSRELFGTKDERQEARDERLASRDRARDRYEAKRDEIHAKQEDRAAERKADSDAKAASGPTTHKLGSGSGSLLEHQDGTMSYRKSMELTQAFRVRVADVTGFAVTKDGKLLERTFRIYGGGTELAAVSVNHGTSEKIEQVFRQHPDFRGGKNSTPAAPSSASSVADELAQLADLHDSGVLTDAEFRAAKARVLGT